MIIKFNDEKVIVDRVRIQVLGTSITISEPCEGQLAIYADNETLVIEPRASNAIIVIERQDGPPQKQARR